MAKHPRDRFDEVPDDLERVGAHRAEARRGRGWIVFAWAALATGVLVGAGVVYLGVANDSFQFVAPTSDETAQAESETPAEDAEGEEAETGSAAPTPSPETVAPADPDDVDPDVTTITVLNGTDTSGLAGSASGALADGGWTVAGQGNADGDTAAVTIVYYVDEADEAVARGVARDLGTTEVEQSDAFPDSSVTIVLGSDYTP